MVDNSLQYITEKMDSQENRSNEHVDNINDSKPKTWSEKWGTMSGGAMESFGRWVGWKDIFLSFCCLLIF